MADLVPGRRLLVQQEGEDTWLDLLLLYPVVGAAWKAMDPDLAVVEKNLSSDGTRIIIKDDDGKEPPDLPAALKKSLKGKRYLWTPSDLPKGENLKEMI